MHVHEGVGSKMNDAEPAQAVRSGASKSAPKAENAYAVVCGPPIMIKYTLPAEY
jgi:hypothetical protein